MRQKASALAHVIDIPVDLSALLIIPTILMEEMGTGRLQTVATAMNWSIWIAFVFELSLWLVVDLSWATIWRRKADVAIILLSAPFLGGAFLQATRSLRLLRFIRLWRAGVSLAVGVRATRQFFLHRRFYFVILVGIAVVLLGAVGIFLVEGHRNPSLSSFGDALWWSVVTATTVGYGDVSPTTLEGRMIAAVLMLTGIGVIGVFTATVASYFLEQAPTKPDDDVAIQLARIEAKLDALLKERLLPTSVPGPSSTLVAPGWTES